MTTASFRKRLWMSDLYVLNMICFRTQRWFWLIYVHVISCTQKPLCVHVACTLVTMRAICRALMKVWSHHSIIPFKVIWKPRPVGNEVKNLADAASQIILNLELFERKEPMSTKESVKPFGATTATTIRFTQPYHGSGCRVIADSWFGSVKCGSELMKHGLYCIMLVKTAHKDFPWPLLWCKEVGASWVGRVQHWMGWNQTTGLSFQRP